MFENNWRGCRGDPGGLGEDEKDAVVVVGRASGLSVEYHGKACAVV